MLMCRLIIISLFVLNNYIMSMQEISLNKLQKFDEAHIVATSQPDTWNNYSLSSRLVAEIIKKRKLLLSGDPTQEEVGVIKNMKKNQQEQYSQLVAQLCGVLQVAVNDVECLRAGQYSANCSNVEDNINNIWSINFAVYP